MRSGGSSRRNPSHLAKITTHYQFNFFQRIETESWFSFKAATRAVSLKSKWKSREMTMTSLRRSDHHGRVAGYPISCQSDVYSLGVVMWSMIMRRNPDRPGHATPLSLTAACVANAKLLQPNPGLRLCASELVKGF